MRPSTQHRASAGTGKTLAYCAFVAAVVATTAPSARTAAFSPSSPRPRTVSKGNRDDVPPLRASSESQSPFDFDELEDEMEPFIVALEETTGAYDLEERLVELPVMFAGERDGQAFDIERWNAHRSSGRYVRLLFGVFSSVTTRRILPTVTILGVWSAAVDLYNSVEHLYGLPELELPLTPFELTAPILGLLLVFRSDRAFDRFSAGAEQTWEITCLFKSLTRELLSFTAAPRFSRDERAAAYDLVEACVRLHSWIMTDHLKGKQIGLTEQAEFLRLAIGPSATTTRRTREGDGPPKRSGVSGTTTGAPLTPSAGIAAVSLGANRRLPSLDFQESTLLESQFNDLVSSIGRCEMMLRTPIPLGYTRYSVRFLWIWLSLLPFALVNKFAEFGSGTWWEDKPQPVLVFAVFFIGFLFSSIEDIAVQIEEPFGVLPLELHQEWLARDAGQVVAMNRHVDGPRREGPITETSDERRKEIRQDKQKGEIQDEPQTINGTTKRKKKSFRRKLGM